MLLLRVSDRCLDRVMYSILVFVTDNVCLLRNVPSLHSVSVVVNKRHAKILDGLLNTSSAILMYVYCINCLGYVVIKFRTRRGWYRACVQPIQDGGRPPY